MKELSVVAILISVRPRPRGLSTSSLSKTFAVVEVTRHYMRLLRYLTIYTHNNVRLLLLPQSLTDEEHNHMK